MEEAYHELPAGGEAQQVDPEPAAAEMILAGGSAGLKAIDLSGCFSSSLEKRIPALYLPAEAFTSAVKELLACNAHHVLPRTGEFMQQLFDAVCRSEDADLAQVAHDAFLQRCGVSECAAAGEQSDSKPRGCIKRTCPFFPSPRSRPIMKQSY